MCDKSNREGGIAIRKDDFDKELTLYAFVNDPCELGGDYANLLRIGITHSIILFRRSMDVLISCMAVGTFPAFVKIDKTRNVTLLRS